MNATKTTIVYLESIQYANIKFSTDKGAIAVLLACTPEYYAEAGAQDALIRTARQAAEVLYNEKP